MSDTNVKLEVEFGTERVVGKDHAKLENLDYMSSGHTGFQPAGDYVTNTELENKHYVVSQPGKGLSANDFTDSYKTKLEGLENYNDSEVRSDIASLELEVQANENAIDAIRDGASLDSFSDVELALTGKVDKTSIGSINGVAGLDSNGRVPSTQLPSYVDDVLEYASVSNFPATGETGKIYVAKDTNLTYRWGGSDYVEISPSLALGETPQTAYRGDRGKTAYNHATEAKISTSKTQKLYKVGVTSQGHISSAEEVTKEDLTSFGLEDSSNKVTGINETNTDSQYPSAKSVYDMYEQMSSELEDSTATGTEIDTTGGAYWKAEIELNGNTGQDTISYLDIGNWEQGGIDSTDGSNVFDDTLIRTANFIQIKPNVLFEISRTIATSYMMFRFYDSSYNYLGSQNTTGMLTTNVTNNRMEQNETTMEMTINNTNVAYMKLVDASNDVTTVYTISTEATPSPDYPQDIQVVKGENNVKIQNKNLAGNWERKSINSYNQIVTSTTRLMTDYIQIDYNQNYIFKLINNYCIHNIFLFDANKNVVNSISSSSGQTNFNFRIDNESYAYIRVIIRNQNSSEEITLEEIPTIQPQLEKGSIATDYIPHQEQTYPITLPEGMEMLQIGSHRDEIVGTPNNWTIPNKSIKIASYNGETITTDYISTTGGLDTGATVYYAGSTDYQITDTTLINQLNDFYDKLKTYQGVTHITQSNAEIPFILKLNYKKSNILRIQALEQAILSQGANV